MADLKFGDIIRYAAMTAMIISRSELKGVPTTHLAWVIEDESHVAEDWTLSVRYVNGAKWEHVDEA